MATSGGSLVDTVERKTVGFQSIQEEFSSYFQHCINTADALPTDSTIDDTVRLLSLIHI
mgnify:CR=1 FL=1